MPTLSAEWLRAAPSISASPASCMSRTCRLIATTEPSPPIANDSTASATGTPANGTTSTSVTAVATNPSTIERSTSQSAIRPAIQVPPTEPTPNASRNSGTAPAPRPASSVTSFAM